MDAAAGRGCILPALKRSILRFRSIAIWMRGGGSTPSCPRIMRPSQLVALLTSSPAGSTTASPPNIRAYEQFNAPGARKHLLLAPYAHSWQIDSLQELQMQWLDHWLKGIENDAEGDLVRQGREPLAQ